VPTTAEQPLLECLAGRCRGIKAIPVHPWIQLSPRSFPFQLQEEGIVLKQPGSRWRPNDRSGAWLKLKPDYIHVRCQRSAALCLASSLG
jgi:ATP-dependent DNA ligase